MRRMPDTTLPAPPQIHFRHRCARCGSRVCDAHRRQRRPDGSCMRAGQGLSSSPAPLRSSFAPRQVDRRGQAGMLRGRHTLLATAALLGCSPAPTGDIRWLTQPTRDQHALFFPVASGPHAVECNSCHGVSETFRDFDCLTCHAGGRHHPPPFQSGRLRLYERVLLRVPPRRAGEGRGGGRPRAAIPDRPRRRGPPCGHHPVHELSRQHGRSEASRLHRLPYVQLDAAPPCGGGRSATGAFPIASSATTR